MPGPPIASAGERDRPTGRASGSAEVMGGAPAFETLWHIGPGMVDRGGSVVGHEDFAGAAVRGR